MNERDLFIGALQIDDPAGRAAFLDKACGDDGELRQRINALLTAFTQAGSFLLQPATNTPITSDAPLIGMPLDSIPGVESPGTLIGPYKLLQQIGEGGFGVVFLAEQSEPVRRKVALKVLKPGMDSRQVVARFEAERQALAIMDHPNIAKVFDGGITTPSGRPYFVMELVKGVPITEFCDQNHLSPRQRLELFVSVCQAVQHAHHKGVIHRDLKPSNVLVSRHDTTPIVKVIDFGVAKALGQVLTDKTLFTGIAQMIGTPLYMSPEQAGQSDLDIDTRSDVYSLGVLLYELLTGTTPFHKERFKKVAYDEIRRIIREEEPPKPSTRLSESKDALSSISAQRQTEPGKLTKLVRGELDWIVMKALEKDRNRRYETVNGFAADVQRYLADEAVQACPPSAAYRLRKFVRRNRVPVLGTIVVLLLLIAGVVGTSVGLVRAGEATDAERQAKLVAQSRLEEVEKANQVAQKRFRQVEKANQILAMIFDDLDPTEQAVGRTLSAQLGKRLSAAAEQLEGEAVGDPSAVAGLQSDLGDALRSLGYPQQAVEILLKARRTMEAHLGPDHPDMLICLNNLALAYKSAGQFDKAVPLYEQTLALKKVHLGLDDPSTLRTMSNLSIAYLELEEFEKALSLAKETLRRQQDRLGHDDPETLVGMQIVAMCYARSGKLDRAVPLYRRALTLTETKLGPDSFDTILCRNNLADALGKAGQLDEAIAILEQVLDKFRATIGADHPSTLKTMGLLAGMYGSAGQHAKALTLLEQTLAKRRIRPGPSHPHTFLAMRELARGYLAVGQFAHAEPLLREYMAHQDKARPEHSERFNARSLLGASLVGQKKYAMAEPLLVQGYEGLSQAEQGNRQESKMLVADALQRLVELYCDWGKKEQAADWRTKLEAHKKRQ